MDITVKNNLNVFILSLALCGWEYEKVYSKKQSVPIVYKEIKEEILSHGLKIHKFDYYFKEKNPYWYFRWVLKHTEYPEYEISDDYSEEEKKFFEKFDELFLDFAKSVEYEKYLKKIKSFLKNEIDKYEKITSDLIEKTHNILKANTADLKDTLVIPNYLAIIGSGFAILDDPRKLIIITGPPKDKNDNLSELIVHEYLHNIVNPLTDKFLKEKATDTPKCIVSDFFLANHPKYWMVLNEYIVRSLVILITADNIEKAVERERDVRGFVKIKDINSVIENEFDDGKKIISRYDLFLDKVNEILLKN